MTDHPFVGAIRGHHGIERGGAHRPIRIPQEADEDGPIVGSLDAARLERVVLNLLTNAVKYSPAGGDVEVTLRAERRSDGNWAELTVRDSGIGIPAEDLPRVFERFYRASNVGEHLRGSGLGLAGARQIVEQHGGEIGVRSEPGAGTTFIVRLPLDGDEESGVRSQESGDGTPVS